MADEAREPETGGVQDVSKAFSDHDADLAAIAEEAPLASGRARGDRPLWFSLGVIALSVYFMIFLRYDLLYYFANAEPVSLGDAEGFAGTDVASDAYVAISGIRNPSKGVYFKGWFSEVNVFQLMGTKTAFVETRKRDDEKSATLDRLTFAGRLMRLGDVSYYSTLRDFAAFNFGIDIPEDAIVIRTQQKPGQAWHIPFFYAVLLALTAFNAWRIVRRLSPKK
ncbi:MAG: hypothetical protein C4523_09680 [Myxococcales bacterium]|nr:MAG: hypothetical protein C4523_09680 [Myxococcales bacterium]